MQCPRPSRPPRSAPSMARVLHWSCPSARRSAVVHTLLGMHTCFPSPNATLESQGMDCLLCNCLLNGPCPSFLPDGRRDPAAWRPDNKINEQARKWWLHYASAHNGMPALRTPHGVPRTVEICLTSVAARELLTKFSVPWVVRRATSRSSPRPHPAPFMRRRSYRPLRLATASSQSAPPV